MPGLIENHRKWTEHNWDHGGHRWSPGGTRTGTALMWARSIRPRLGRALPAASVLEIAPGFGRWTTHLLEECHHLIGVDITPRCIEVCREQFGTGTEFYVNDGASLPMVAADSIDFAFSLDSLVHVEAPQVQTYLHELGRTLKRGATAFLHHSNLGVYADALGVIGAYVGERHWRAPSMSSRQFREACRRAGLHCASQEVINWIGRDTDVDRHRLPGEQIALTDCFSICVKDVETSLPTRVVVNQHFVEEWRELIALAASDARAEATAVSPETRHSARGLLAATRARWRGFLFAQREPLGRLLRADACPDCGDRLQPGDGWSRCPACHAEFRLH